MVEQLSPGTSNPEACRASSGHSLDRDEWDGVLLPGIGNWDKHADDKFKCEHTIADRIGCWHVGEVEPVCGLDGEWDLCGRNDMHLF